MADVLIVCVREDEPQAKALAEMFEAAGFSIGGAPSSDTALRSSGAGVVVWSQASIRSRPFLDAAQRVINANKAVVASLIEPPPPASVGDAATFDLSRWEGDPDDSALDPLFFAVDRMVNSARAAVGAPAAQPSPATFEPPPNLRPPPAVVRPTPRPAPQPAPAPSDPLRSEAEHWRSIRHSRDPAVFLDYLARYGAEGAFADVAELRLKELTDGEARTTARPTVAPAPRIEPRRPEPPPRRPDPPPRRAEAPPPPRREPPAYERRYERAEMREPPPKAEGGALRAFVLIALLGGAALAGALYFGGGMNAPAPRDEIVEPVTPPPAELQEQDLASASPGASLSEAATPPRRETQTPRREPAAAAPPRREPEPEPEAPTPAPVTSWNGATTNTAANSGGPVSLQPGANSGPGVVVPLSPPQTNQPSPQPQRATPAATSPPATQRAAPPPQGTVQWAQRPSARRISDLYPSRALRDGVGGRVELDCTVLADLSLACSVATESPGGMAFGRAALSAAGSYRARPALSSGASAVGSRARIAVHFQAPS